VRRSGRRIREARELVRNVLAHVLYTPYRWRLALRRDKRRKLQIGSGANPLPGWINADVGPRAELIVLLEKRLPFEDEFLNRIYLEHVLEHASYETAVSFLRDARRVLKPGGVVRIAVPDLEDLARGYVDGDWRRFDWVNWPEHAFIKTGAQMINVGFRAWGHQHLYDREELGRALAEAGFTEFEFVTRAESRYDDLRGLETRPDSTLIVEAKRT
jgi:predicted SAM-dependent methyltransferase